MLQNGRLQQPCNLLECLVLRGEPRPTSKYAHRPRQPPRLGKHSGLVGAGGAGHHAAAGLQLPMPGCLQGGTAAAACAHLCRSRRCQLL
jgi:hypothetical protein